MGSGKPRSNIATVSGGKQVVTESGEVAIDCFIDEVLSARVDPLVDVKDRRGEVVLQDDGSPALVVDDHAVASLTSRTDIARLVCCIQRGYAFVGAVVSPGAIRVWTER